MFQGYYTLGSNMISENRNLNVISNNMANAATPGYKTDKYIASTFKDEIIYRTGNKTPYRRTPIGTTSRIQATNERVTDYEQGGLEPTELPLDCALNGTGYFVIQTDDGLVYSRNGSFITDEQGYLTLSGIGRVMGVNGPIQMTTDSVVIDTNGTVRSEETDEVFGRIQLVDFADYTQMIKGDNGTFTTEEGAAEAQPNAQIIQGMLESSNIDMVEEMTSMISAQRALQSAAQLLKIYDQLDAKTVTLGSLS